MTNIKTIQKDNYILIHERFRDERGFLVDSFNFTEKKDGKIINRPFLAPIKAKNYDEKSDIMDCTTDYTEQEYQEMFEGMTKTKETDPFVRTKGLYRGKPIEEYTKEELEDIAVELGEAYNEVLKELCKRPRKV